MRPADIRKDNHPEHLTINQKGLIAGDDWKTLHQQELEGKKTIPLWIDPGKFYIKRIVFVT